MGRVISWFSCGAASAVATKLMIEKYPTTQVVRIVIDNEHEDNSRFADDCAQWFGRPILELRSTKYKDCWDVWEKERWLNGPGGAKCTVELKKKIRRGFQKHDDIQSFGYTFDEKDRAIHLIENNLELFRLAKYPLIAAKLTKEDCFKRIEDAGLLLPMPYRLGLHNANCIGCVKGGMGYWNRIRELFPDVFDRMSKLERNIGASCIKGVYLDELDPKRGRHEDIRLPSCGFVCEPVQLSLFK
jgi:hypothetical protein